MRSKAASMPDKSTYIAHMCRALNGSTVLQCFKRGNAVEIRNKIMFDFYSGLPHLSDYYQRKQLVLQVFAKI